MKLLLAVTRYELKLQLRSARFRIAATGYLGLCALPPGVMYFVLRHRSAEALGGAAYLAQLLQVQPYCTLLMVALVAGNRSGTGALEESWAVLAASPMSNAGYVLRRALALLTLIIPLTLVPQALALGAAVAAGNTSFDPVTWIGNWALWILPAAVFFTCYWLAWVTVTGSELAALIFTFAGLPMVISAANQILLKFHLTLSGYLEFLGYRPLFYWIAYTLQSLSDTPTRFHPGYAATEGPFDLASAAAWSLPRWSLIGGLAGLGLGLAVAFVRRTRRDLKPRPVPPKHQLRTFLEKLNRWRERYAPDGGLGLRERLAAAAGIVVLGLALSALLGRQLTVQRLAAERYLAETKPEIAPLPAGVQPSTWQLRGRIDRHGGVEIDAAGRFENHGSAAQETLAFTLNPELEIKRLEVPTRSVKVVRAWDRLQLRLDPALAPGETLDLELRLVGMPMTIDFRFRSRGSFPFPREYQRLVNARFPREVGDLSMSWVRRAASPRRVLLAASDLGPVPRYTPWTLTRPGESRGEGYRPSDYGGEVPVEVTRTVVDLDLDLEGPAEWFLADTCGHVSHLERRADDVPVAAGRARLSGACRTSLTELMVAGGRLVKHQEVSGSASREGAPNSVGDAPSSVGEFAPRSEVVVATLPEHRELVARKLRSLTLVASLSDRAWPGMPGLEGLVALEWPPEFHLDLYHDMSRWNELEPKLVGRLLLIPERLLIDDEPFEAEDLVARLLSRDLLERRELAADQELIFRYLFRALMIRRMGLDGDRGATVSGKPWLRQSLRRPILSIKDAYGYGYGIISRHRMPGVLADIEGRVGGDNLYGAIESFLAAGGEEPGTIEELLAAVEARSGVSLERTYQDHFLGRALPILRLEDVSSRRQGDGWVVEGKMRNTGTGQSICPVIVKTEISERMLTVTVDSESATPFIVRTERRPHTVLLDPERTCYRWLLKTSSALERANLLG